MSLGRGGLQRVEEHKILVRRVEEKDNKGTYSRKTEDGN